MAYLPVPPLQPGALVAVVAPSGPFDRALLERGLARLGARYRVELAPHLFEAQRYLAGDDATRAEDFARALEAPAVRAVFAARGGYGLMRVAPRLPAMGAKALVGFSDFTVAHQLAQARGFRSLHAPVLTQLATQPDAVVERLVDALEGRALAPLDGTRTVVGGIAEGPLVGGNLATLASLAGTPLLRPFEGAVVLLEDVGERPYRLDRLWTQLLFSGALGGVRGLLLGDFSACEEKGADYSSADVLDGLARALGVPCAAGFPIGHGAVNQPVPLGARVRLDADARRVHFLEGLTA